MLTFLDSPSNYFCDILVSLLTSITHYIEPTNPLILMTPGVWGEGGGEVKQPC